MKKTFITSLILFCSVAFSQQDEETFDELQYIHRATQLANVMACSNLVNEIVQKSSYDGNRLSFKTIIIRCIENKHFSHDAYESLVGGLNFIKLRNLNRIHSQCLETIPKNITEHSYAESQVSCFRGLSLGREEITSYLPKNQEYEYAMGETIRGILDLSKFFNYSLKNSQIEFIDENSFNNIISYIINNCRGISISIDINNRLANPRWPDGTWTYDNSIFCEQGEPLAKLLFHAGPRFPRENGKNQPEIIESSSAWKNVTSRIISELLDKHTSSILVARYEMYENTHSTNVPDYSQNLYEVADNDASVINEALEKLSRGHEYFENLKTQSTDNERRYTISGHIVAELSF